MMTFRLNNQEESSLENFIQTYTPWIEKFLYEINHFKIFVQTVRKLYENILTKINKKLLHIVVLERKLVL